MVEGTHIMCLEVETLHSANECRHCGQPHVRHDEQFLWCAPKRSLLPNQRFEAIGWDDHATLGLSIGGYWDSADCRIHWFDGPILAATIQHLVHTQPLIVSFNGLACDFPVMQAVLRHHAFGALSACGFTNMPVSEDASPVDQAAERGGVLLALGDRFADLCTRSYDILAAIWQAAPESQFQHGLHSLGVLAQANGLDPTRGHGAQAPSAWQDGRIASVLNACQDDIYTTKALFERIVTQGEILLGDGRPIRLPLPTGRTP